MSRAAVLDDAILRIAARNAVIACGTLIARTERSMLDREQARQHDEATHSLVELARALEPRA